MTNYSHPKCYAKSTGACSHKISKEHLISDNILRDFEENKTVKIAGLPWIEHQTFNLLSRKSLVSHVLCENHNHQLSPYDAEAGEFLRCLNEFDSDFNAPQPSNEVKQFNGEFLEKWMLKVLCGLIASNQISEGGERKPVPLKEIYVGILFNGNLFPDTWGLYFKVPAANEVHKFNSVSFQPKTGGGEVKCVEVLLHNFTFYLLLGIPQNPNEWGVRHVHLIRLVQNTITKIAQINWPDSNSDRVVEFTRVRTSNEAPQDWENWMKR